jgi:hypothetical protein
MGNIKWYFLLALVDFCYVGQYFALWESTKERKYLLNAISFFLLGFAFSFKIFQFLR